MKNRRFPLFVLLGGLLLTSIGLLLPIVFSQAGGASTGIIGGADAHTYRFLLTHYLGGLPFCLALIGAAMVLTSLPSAIFPRAFQRICCLKTSAITLSLSALGGFGLTCALYCLVLGAFHERSKHPIGYPLSLGMGSLSFCAFILLIALYFDCRKKAPSMLGMVYDVYTSVVYLPAFFFSCNYIVNLF